jgi:hypothetical protein
MFRVLVSFAPTCGINKDGQELYIIDASTGRRTDTIDDQLRKDVNAALAGRLTKTTRWIPSDKVSSGYAVPAYYDDRTINALDEVIADSWPDFTSIKLGDLADSGLIVLRVGHGSPSADMRCGNIPYIKVSDLRAGQLNINPTNLVSKVVAERYWRAQSSGLRPYDLVTPIRASKNIGDFSVIMPGQEQVVLTKEVLVMRPGAEANFDCLYLAWAMSLNVVREQWSRIVFMQTNREDAGTRYRDILIPVPATAAEAEAVSAPFRAYYEGSARLRGRFIDYLSRDEQHHVFLATVDDPATSS